MMMENIEAMRVKSDKWTAWVEDDRTYIYDQARNVVLVEPAITMGMDPERGRLYGLTWPRGFFI